MAVLIATFVFFACSFTSSNEKHGGYVVHTKPDSGLQPNAPAINDVQLFFYQKSVQAFVTNTLFNGANDNYRLIADNRLIDQRIVTLLKSAFLIKPGLPRPFHFLYHYPDPDLPQV